MMSAGIALRQMLSALSQGLGNDGRVCLWPGFELQLGVTSGAGKTLWPQFHKTGGNNAAVWQLFAHVAVVYTARKMKGTS
jgi:hypothetical protein